MTERTGTHPADILLPFHVPIQGELARVEEDFRHVVSSSPPRMREPLRHAVKARGKWVRAAIAILAARLRPSAPDAPTQMGTAVELLHLATLVHDDTVDQAEVRRGQATLSSLYGPEVAVLVGDYLFASAATYVCDTGNTRVIRRFVAKTIMELATGELDERLTLYDWQQTREAYLGRIYNKTASLFSTAAECGAVLSGAPEEEIQRLHDFGTNLGMAFQVVDDILDFEGTASEVGKPVGHDLAQGVLTLPALLFLERYPRDNPVIDLCQAEDPKDHLDRALSAIRGSGLIAEAYRIADGYRRRALEVLAPLPDSPHRQGLLDVAAYVLERSR